METPTPRTSALVRELCEDAMKRKAMGPIPVQEPFDRAINLCFQLERELVLRKALSKKLSPPAPPVGE